MTRKAKHVVEYFFILTISWTDGRDVNIRTRTGVATADEGQSQESIYTRLFEEACAGFGAPKFNAGVTFYYLARNET